MMPSPEHVQPDGPGKHASRRSPSKINREDISGILQTFERHEYVVKSTYQGSNYHEDLRDGSRSCCATST